MSKIINIDELKIKIWHYQTGKITFDDLIIWIERQSFTDYAKHGHWINAYPEIEPNPMFMYGICSICGFKQSISDKLKFCPECGSVMDELKEK